MSNLRKSTTYKTRETVRQELQTISEFSKFYKFHFFLKGEPDSGFNTIKLASFINSHQPAEYHAIKICSEKTVVFWNPKNS